MVRLYQIYAAATLILLTLSQIVESRAGGGESGGGGGGGVLDALFLIEAILSFETTDLNINALIVTAFIIFIYIAMIANSVISISKEFEKKHKEIIEELSNDPESEFICNESEIISNVNQSFIDLQKAWSEQDLNFLEGKLSRNLFLKWKDILAYFRDGNKKNIVSNVIVNKIRFVRLDKQEKTFTVLIDADIKDLTVDLSTEKILKDQSGGFKEFWTYMWGTDGWLLMEINQFRERMKFL